MKDRYYSKVILFGEYSMIFDATALMIPLKRFSAQWQFPQSRNKAASLTSNQSLKRFCQYLAGNETLSSVLNLSVLDKDLDEGLFLASNVPSGYGLGSSGTLVAAVYDRYALQKTNDCLQLKSLFSLMESYFHGSSSGIDPLQCYLGQPFKITSDGVRLLSDDFLKQDIHICLIDTKIKSNTKPLVNHFKAQRENPEFLNRFQNQYVPNVTSCINSMIEGNKELFFQSLKQLTKGQLEFLRPMITDNTLDLFTADYDFHFGVKISGSGGGGYVLGFTDNLKKANELLCSEGMSYRTSPCIDSLRLSPRNDMHGDASVSMPSKFDVIWL